MGEIVGGKVVGNGISDKFYLKHFFVSSNVEELRGVERKKQNNLTKFFEFSG